MPKIRRTSFVIAVPDLEASAAFYRDTLGFAVDDPGSVPGWRFYSLGGCTIMAGRCPTAIPPAQLGDHSYFAYLEIDGLDTYYEAVRASGAQICHPPRDEPWGMREFCLQTADGHRIMFGSPIIEGDTDDEPGAATDRGGMSAFPDS